MTAMSVTQPASRISRRRFGALTIGALASLTTGGACRSRTSGQHTPAEDGVILARPKPGVTTSASGTIRLELAPGRDGVLRIPAAPASGLFPLLVLLHGAGGAGASVLRRLGSLADDLRVAVLAPDSRDSSWDAIRDDFGPDVTFIGRALERTFDTLAIDPARISVGGFSDGATYALSLGLINGELFRRVLAFSPGFIVEGTAHGKPRIFVSHGTDDQILPIDRCSRPIVRSLQKRGYEVTFREFQGGHEIPASIAREGVQWVS
jgi:phospholipase/carboxylesterase